MNFTICPKIMLNVQRQISHQASQGEILEPLRSLEHPSGQIMDKSIERAATNGHLQTSCYQNGKLITAFTTGSCFPWEIQHFTKPSHINFKCHLLFPESSCVARTAAPVNCSFCTPARVTLGGNSDKLIKWQQLKLPGTGNMCHLSYSKLTVRF